MSPAHPSGTGAPNPGGDNNTMSRAPRSSSSATSSDQMARHLGIAVDEHLRRARGHARVVARSHELVNKLRTCVRRSLFTRTGGRFVEGGGGGPTVPPMTTEIELTERSRTARRVGSVLEPVVGQVYFSPECHAELRRTRVRSEPRRRQRRRAARWPVVLLQPRQRHGAGPRRGDRRRLRRVQPGDRRAPGRHRLDTDRRRDDPRGPGRRCGRPAPAHPRRCARWRRTGGGTPRRRVGTAADRRPPAGRRHPLAAGADRPAGGGLASRRLPA